MGWQVLVASPTASVMVCFTREYAASVRSGDWPGAHRWLNEHQRKSVKASSKHRRFLCLMNLTFLHAAADILQHQETSDSAAPPRSCTAWSNSSAALEPMRRRRSCEVNTGAQHAIGRWSFTGASWAANDASCSTGFGPPGIGPDRVRRVFQNLRLEGGTSVVIEVSWSIQP